MTGEGDGYGEVVGPKGGRGGPHHIREEMPAQKSDIWQGRVALGGEANRVILDCNGKLQTVDCLIKGLSSGHSPVIPCPGIPGGIVGVKVAEHHLVPSPPERRQSQGQKEADGIHTLTKVNVVLLRSVSTARTSAVSSSGSMSP